MYMYDMPVLSTHLVQESNAGTVHAIATRLHLA